ncbi:Uncharacterised protein [Bordetella pertussis]|nr:Uncharacterised protein [Bordetella pertussis]CFW29992.1 Uncharacterised protein [Bordetella pertussis]
MPGRLQQPTSVALHNERACTREARCSSDDETFAPQDSVQARTLPRHDRLLSQMRSERIAPYGDIRHGFDKR